MECAMRGCVLVICVAMSACGCTGIEPALVGVAITGVGAGVGATRMGKINVAFVADGPSVVEAATAAADELGVTIVELDHRNTGRWVMELRDLRRNTIIVAVDQRGRNATHLQVNVGWFGSVAIGQLLTKRIQVHLFGIEDEALNGYE
jgi:hypothetical protein